MSRLREEEKKLFVKMVDSLCGSHSRWEIWKDMIWMFAITISNTVDVQHREKREKQYLDIAKHYSKNEMQTFSELFAHLVMSLERGGHRDFLGDLFMELRLGNDAGGQFFTPYSLCEAMAEIEMPDVKEKIEKDGYISINDPACGAGATLIAAADIMYNKRHINYQTTAMFIGQEIDYTTALMCYIQLSLFGCAGYVHIGNTLTNPMTGHVLFGDGGENTWYTPMYFSTPWEMRRQAVLMKAFFQGVEQGIKEHAPEALPESATQSKSVEPEPVEPEPTIIQVSGKKARGKPQGQLMFEI